MRIVIIGEFWRGSLEGSYAQALRVMGNEVECVDFKALLQRHSKLGVIGKYINTYIPIDAWNMRAARELVETCYSFAPELIIVGGITPIRAGVIYQLKASRCLPKVVLLWSDPLIYLRPWTVDALRLYDKVYCFSRAGTNIMVASGVRAKWHPFGADTFLFPEIVQVSADDIKRYQCDVLFVGNHRPKREEILTALERFGLNVKVWGPRQWKDEARCWSAVKRYWQGSMLFGEDIAKAARVARVCLNIVDETCPDAMNMRVFEIGACRGLQVCSRCAEAEEVFVAGKHCFYYGDIGEIVDVCKTVASTPNIGLAIAECAANLVRSKHSYLERAGVLVNAAFNK